MEQVTDEIVALITKQMQDHGLIVWYDSEQVYDEVVDQVRLPETTVLRYHGSFLELRHRLEPFLEFVDDEGRFHVDSETPPRVLIYVPLARGMTQHALIEAEAAGVVMEPGGSPWQRNTRLKLLAERVFKRIAPDRAGAIAAEVEAGRRTLAELDWLDGGVTAVPGILAGGVAAGIKPSGNKDLALIYSSTPARVAAVFTSNQVKGAPVLVSMEHARGGQAQAIVASSGCSNVCTGERGIRDAREMTKLVGELLRIPATHVLVASTGIIGVPLPMDKIRARVRELARRFHPDVSGGNNAQMCAVLSAYERIRNRQPAEPCLHSS